MDDQITWLDQLIDTLADARALLACFGLDQPALTVSIDAALDEAQALKRRAIRP